MDYQAVPSIGLAHMGFQLVYEHVRGSLSTLLTSQCAGAQRILVTGHSLGGAVAVLSRDSILPETSWLEPCPEFYTFAGPRAVDPGFFGKIQFRVSGLQPDGQFHGRGSAGAAAAGL